jgi:hypothetical protein
MSEEGASSGPQTKYQVHIIYQLAQNNAISDSTELLFMEADNAIQAARMALTFLEQITPAAGKVTTAHMTIVIDPEAANDRQI